MNLQDFKEKQKSFGHLVQKSKWHITEQKIRIQTLWRDTLCQEKIELLKERNDESWIF